MDEAWHTLKMLIKREGRYFLEYKRINVRDGVVLSIESGSADKDDHPGYVFLPPFCNIHAHLGESVFRSIDGDKWTLASYLDYTDRYNQALSNEKRQQVWEESADFTIAEMENQGITLFCAARSAGPAKRLNELTMAGYPIMNNDKVLAYKKQGIRGFSQYAIENNCDRVSVGIFLHSLYANDRTSLELAKECMENGSEFITVHVSEDEESRRSEIKLYGQPPIMVLEQYGLLSEKTLLVHCGFVDDEELKLIADTGATIIICPISNHFLNTQMPNVNALREKNIRWCIATDGLATGRTFSLIDQARFLQKQFPDISLLTLYEHITCIPGMLFSRKLYTGLVEEHVEDRFIQVPYGGDSAYELISMIMTNQLEVKLTSSQGGRILCT